MQKNSIAVPSGNFGLGDGTLDGKIEEGAS